MTDDRDRPMTQHLPPPSPDDPSAGQSSRTDAPALRDADALDAWLDARASSSHAGAAATPATDRAGQNGQSLWLSSRSTTTTDAASLTGAASRFHARVAAAEEAEAPPAPVDAIWEQIMATSVLTPIPGVAAPTAHAHSPARAERPERHPFLRTAGSHPAATAVLVAAVILATILVFRAFDRNTPPPIVDQGPAALAPDASATPSISPVASDVWLQPITSTECTQPGTSSDPHEQAAYLLRQFWACNSGERPLTLYSDDLLTRHPELRTGQFTLSQEDVTRAQAIAPAIAEADPQLTIPDLPAVANNWLPAVFLPRNAIPLDDGRFALPMTYAPPVGSPTPAATNQQTSVLLYVFTMQDGHPHIDDILTSCLGDCDAIWAQQGLQIGTPKPSDSAIATRATQQAATAEARIASPVSSPEASPSTEPVGTRVWATPAPGTVFTDPWLQPIDPSECERPYTDETFVNEQAALVARQFVACGEGGTPVIDLAPQVFSPDFLTRHPGYLSGNSTLTEDDVARAEAISTAVVAAKPTLTVMGLPGADDQSSRTDGFYEVFLPQQNTIQLDDGRFAIPLTIAFTDEARATAAATEIASSTGTPVTVAVVVFTLQDGSPRIDDLLLGCIAHCDGFWAQQRAMTGTPQTNVDLATPAIRPTATIDPSANLPIPASECVVPTIAVGNEALPERQYAPPLKPTDANATAVTSDARAFIACAEATPSTGDIQDVIAPFETERLRNEMDANPDQPQTTEQIEAGKRISAYLEEQGVTSFAERAPADAVDPSQTVTPRSVGGWTITPPGFYTVPMPGVAIQFPDGRIGIPTLMMVTTDDLWADLQNRAYTSGSLGIFARVGDTWLLDETLGLCIGECDPFWQDAATPSGDSQWLQPVNASECQPVSASTYREYVRPRDYTIVNVPASGGGGVARQGRAWVACSPNGFLGNSTIDRQFETQRFADAGGTTQPLTDEQITRAMELSEHYQDAGYQVFQRAPEDLNLAGNPAAKQASFSDQEFTYTYVFEPDEAIGLSDGRVAIPVTILFADDGTSTTVENRPTQATLLAVWAYVGETWLLDETLPICLGDCAGFWANPPATDFPTSSPVMNIWFQVFTVNPNAADATSAGTPRAIPVATPASTDSDLAFWLSEPGVGDCVPPDVGVISASNTRAYLPWTAPDENTARQIALAGRNRVACNQRPNMTSNAGVSSSRYTGMDEPGDTVERERLTLMQDLSAAIPDQDLAAWVYQGQASTASKYTTVWYAVFPENVYRLPDGRYAAIPVVAINASDTGNAESLTVNGYLALPVAIYAQSGDAWLLDEQVAVCLGDCQAYWGSFHVIDAPPGTPGTPATPADLAIVPIDRRTLAVA